MSATQKEYDKFLQVSERIQKEELRTNQTKLTEYRWQLIEAYNVFVTFVVTNFYKIDKEGQARLTKYLKTAREKFIACLNALGCGYELPTNIYEMIEEATIGAVTVEIATDSNASASGASASSRTAAPPPVVPPTSKETEARKKLEKERQETRDVKNWRQKN